MKMRIIRLIALSAAFSSSVTYAPQKNLLELAHAIVKATHRSGRRNAREKLLHGLKHPRPVNQATLAYIFTAFHHKKDSHLWDNYAGTINRAIEHFTHTPGFVGKMHDLLRYADNPSFTKGHVYELQAAIMRENRGDRVMQFCYDFYCNKTNCMRSIDLATDQHFIECKNIDWSLYTSNDKAERIRNQLLSYKEFVQSPDNQSERTLLLVSKQPITPKWKQWLDQHEIVYEETH